MKTVKLLLCAMLLSPWFLGAMEGDSAEDLSHKVASLSLGNTSLPERADDSDFAAVAEASDTDVEVPPRFVSCLLCNKPCAAVVGLPHAVRGKMYVFAFCKDCLIRELESNPELWHIFKCSHCQTELQRCCIEHLKVVENLETLADGELPFIDLGLLYQRSILAWLGKEKKRYDLEREIEVATCDYRRLESRRDCYDCCAVGSVSTVIVLLCAFLGTAIATIVYAVKGKDCYRSCCRQYYGGCDTSERNSVCTDSCSDYKTAVILAYVMIGFGVSCVLSAVSMGCFSWNDHERRDLVMKAKKRLEELQEQLKRLVVELDGDGAV